MFHTVSDSERLSPDDAEFVDTVHTAGLWVGMDERVSMYTYHLDEIKYIKNLICGVRRRGLLS